jgi:hypothetical protein
MRTTYKVLAWLVAVEVIVQAAVMVWGVAGMGIWIDDGGVVDKQTFEDAFDNGTKPFDEFTGLLIHGQNGMMVIPLIALALVIVSFFAKIPGGVAYAFAVLGLVVLQVALGLLGHAVSAMGALHGVNAFLLFGVAVLAGRRASSAARPAEEPVSVSA